jgi:hypothetical protein
VDGGDDLFGVDALQALEPDQARPRVGPSMTQNSGPNKVRLLGSACATTKRRCQRRRS